MATDLSELDEAALKSMLEDATDYESRSKIRAAIRELKKKSGQPLGRRAASSSQYRRPGFQAPRTVAIPNSVTGNVYPSVVKDGQPLKSVDKNTPTIGYLGSQGSNKSRKASTDTSSPSHTSTSSNIVPQGSGGPEDHWWRKSRSSSQSTSTPGQTPEPKSIDERRSSTNDAISETNDRNHLSPDPPKEPTPSPEPPKEPTPSPEPPKEPTPSPEPPKEPTPSPEPPKEPTPSPEPPKEPTPSPEPPKEPTPSPEPIKEPTPSPEPPKEPTPSPEPPKEPTPSPEPIKEPTPSPEPADQRDADNAEYDYDDDDDEELRQLEERYPEPTESKSSESVKDVLAVAEPGLEEDKDFRKKLRKSEAAKIDTKAAFPSAKKKAEQVDFRNVLKKSDGPGKKDIKSGSKAQIDFRTNLRSKDSEGQSPVSSPVHPSSSTTDEPTVNKSSLVAKSSVSSDDSKQDNPPPEDSYEARREARRREREQNKKEEPAEASAPSTVSSTDDTTTTSSTAEDSYEARREARRKAREERMKNMADSEPKMSYRERKEKEEAKRRQERSANKQKWAEMDQANGGNSERSFTRQKSSSGQQQLLAWCQHKTRYYENVDVKDFSNSWRDGLALCAILHNFVPELIPYEDLSPSNARENYTVALKAAEDAGLERFFDVDDIIAAGSPDPKSMMTFLATIYSFFK